MSTETASLHSFSSSQATSSVTSNNEKSTNPKHRKQDKKVESSSDSDEEEDVDDVPLTQRLKKSRSKPKRTLYREMLEVTTSPNYGRGKRQKKND